MWIITHIPTGQNILGWNVTDQGFYSYKDAHKMLLTMNKYLAIGRMLYKTDFNGTIVCNYVTLIHKLNKPSARTWYRLRVYRDRHLFKLARAFDTFQLGWEPYKVFLKGNKVVSILCSRTSIRTKTERLKPINLSEFLIHYVN